MWGLMGERRKEKRKRADSINLSLGISSVSLEFWTSDGSAKRRRISEHNQIRQRSRTSSCDFRGMIISGYCWWLQTDNSYSTYDLAIGGPGFLMELVACSKHLSRIIRMTVASAASSGLTSIILMKRPWRIRGTVWFWQHWPSFYHNTRDVVGRLKNGFKIWGL
jgi:hypothetical protein